MADASCLIDGYGPLPLRQPQSVAELGELVRSAAGADQAIYPVGGQTMLGFGSPPTRPGIAVSVGNLAGVVDYPARDMTITVQAGITIARLQEILAPENQQLPIDVPHSGRATLGGILAANVSGPRRLGYGTLRDYVLGISAVNDRGQEIKAGGRVVKNVAGYDLCKLFVGSLGTLGIITQATLKLRPLPEERALITIGCAADRLPRLLDLLHGSRTRPICVELLNKPQSESSSPGGPWVVHVGYDGNASAVQWQVSQLIREVGNSCTLEARVGSTSRAPWQALTESSCPPAGESGLSFKANLLPEGIAEFCVKVDALPARPRLQAHAGNGIVRGHVGPGLACEQAASFMQALRELARPFQGRAVVLDCPASWKQAVSVWGPPADDVWLMRRVKESLDPRRLFNPGRFVDGI